MASKPVQRSTGQSRIDGRTSWYYKISSVHDVFGDMILGGSSLRLGGVMALIVKATVFMKTTALAMTAIVLSKLWDNSAKSGGDISEGIMDSFTVQVIALDYLGEKLSRLY
jgi:hypothetical protein